jgi:cyclopropane-fatty-acyl-phospholipid synthase
VVSGGSAVYEGTLLHARSTPAKHVFRHRVCFYAIDLDELPGLAGRLRLFGHNTRAPLTLRDDDHVGRIGTPIKENILARLAAEGIETGGGRVVMVTNLRVLGYVFNPVSFFFCYRPEGELAAVVAEVGNTFGERHLYLLPAEEARLTGDGRRVWDRPKRMHVSPFFGLDQDYRFVLGEPGETIRLGVGVHEADRQPLWAEQTGTRRPFTDAQLALTLVRHPLMAQRVMGLIHWHALRLWLKRVPFHHLPRFRPGEGSVSTDSGTHADTSTPAGAGRRALRGLPAARRSLRTPFARRLSLWALSHPAEGRISVELPDGTVRSAGDAATGPDVRVTVASKDLWRRIARRGRIGIGEAYTAGDWYADDLVGLMEILTVTGEAVRRSAPGSALTGFQRRRPHLPARADLPGAKRDIQYHYDLGNDLYELFLDPSWTYSCAVFEHPGMTLQEAQEAKYRRICEKLRLTPESHVLEIGCGWGGFALHAAGEWGARVTGLTLSEEQAALARQRVAEAGLSDRVEILLQDYRTMTGRFSHVASIEMLEAIGHAQLPVYFGAIDRLLEPGGSACIQTIACPDQRYERYRRHHDWIREYIFPGALLPSLEAISRAMTRSSDLIVEQVDNIGDHYAETLRQWRERFLMNRDRVIALGYDDRFIRTWEFYLAYCEAAFRVRALHDYQLLITRPFNRALAPAAVLEVAAR